MTYKKYMKSIWKRNWRNEVKDRLIEYTEEYRRRPEIIAKQREHIRKIKLLYNKKKKKGNSGKLMKLFRSRKTLTILPFKEISNQDIRENIERVEKGEALTMPLALLNGYFKKEYIKRTGANIGQFSKTISSRKRNIYFLGNGRYYQKICLICNKNFETYQKNKKFCSKECWCLWQKEVKKKK